MAGNGRCDLSDLPVEMCACRTHRATVHADTWQGMDAAISGRMSNFRAQHPGICEACQATVSVGDPISLNDGGDWVHWRCDEEND